MSTMSSYTRGGNGADGGGGDLQLIATDIIIIVDKRINERIRYLIIICSFYSI
jgi:hypothetical protein